MITLHKLLLILCISIPASLKPMISYKLAANAARKKVLILGDHHSIQDQNIRSYLALFLAHIRGLDLKRPIPFIVEYDNVEDGKLLSADSVAHALHLDAEQKRLGQQTFAFIYYEPRGEESAIINGLHNDIGDCLSSESPSSHIVKHYLKDDFQDELEPYNEADWQKIEKKIRAQNFVKKGLLTTQCYFAHLQKNLELLEGLLVKYRDSPEVIQVLKTLIEEYKSAQAGIMELLQGPDVAIAYSMHFLNKTLEERLIFLDQFEARIKATDYVFADCMFFDKIVDTLATEQCVCILTGNAHTGNQAKLLRAFGCDILQSETLEAYHYPLLESYKVEEYDDDQAPGEKYGKLLNDLIHTALPIFLESTIVVPNTCWTCAEKPEKLMACGICKRAVYCNGSCQKTDWASHKKCCKKPSV